MGKEVSFDLLDSSVEDLADLKTFEPFPVGSYKLELTWDKKEINDRPAVILKLKNLEILELGSVDSTPPEVGSTTDIAIILKTKTGERNKTGEGRLKAVLKVLQPVFGGSSIAEVIKNSEGAIIAATLSVRKDKNDEEKRYNQIESLAIVS